MSAYAEIKTQFSNPDLIVKALEAAGYKIIENHVGSPQALGSSDGRFRTRNDYSNTDNQIKALKADIIVRRGPDSFREDVGFKREADGTYTFIPSNFDARQENKKFDERMKFLYSEANVQTQMQALRKRQLGKPTVREDGVMVYAFAG